MSPNEFGSGERSTEIEGVVFNVGDDILCDAVEWVDPDEWDPNLFDGVVIDSEKAVFNVWSSGFKHPHPLKAGDRFTRDSGESWVIVALKPIMLGHQCACLRFAKS